MQVSVDAAHVPRHGLDIPLVRHHGERYTLLSTENRLRCHLEDTQGRRNHPLLSRANGKHSSLQRQGSKQITSTSSCGCRCKSTYRPIVSAYDGVESSPCACLW